MVETVHQDSSHVEFQKAHRPFDHIHSIRPCIAFHCVQQGVDDFGIVREINPSEAADVLANFAVIFMVDYASDTPDELAIFVGKPIFPLTNLKSPVYLGRKGSHVHGNQLRDIIFIILVEYIRKFGKLPQIPFSAYFLYGYSHFFSLYAPLRYENFQ